MRKRVVRQIEELLFKNEYVVVPGLGAFLRHTIPSEVDEAKGLIYPPKNSLSFNSSLSQSDGILLQSYVLRYGVSQKKAEALLKEDVEDLIRTIRATGLIRLGNLGKLWINSDGKIEFAPDANHPYTTYFFGYAPVVTLSAKSAQGLLTSEIPDKPAKDVVYLPVNLSFIKYGSVAALFALAFLLFPTLLTDKSLAPSSEPQYQAGFLGQASERVTTNNKEVEQTAPKEMAPVRADKKTEKTEVAGRSLFGLPLLTPEKEGTTPRFYVVIATLRSEDAVKQYLQENRPQDTLPGIGIILTNRTSSSGGTYRVYTSVSDTEAAAHTLMQQLHDSTNTYKDAWVYKYPLS